MNTREAIQAMLDGKKVRRKIWYKGAYTYITQFGVIRDDVHANVRVEAAEDWEIYEEPKPKQTVTIEKWLCEYCGGYVVVDGNDLNFMRNEMFTKVKLLDTYEVEI